MPRHKTANRGLVPHRQHIGQTLTNTTTTANAVVNSNSAEVAVTPGLNNSWPFQLKLMHQVSELLDISQGTGQGAKGQTAKGQRAKGKMQMAKQRARGKGQMAKGQTAKSKRQRAKGKGQGQSVDFQARFPTQPETSHGTLNSIS